jgi:hypothetical protein
MAIQERLNLPVQCRERILRACLLVDAGYHYRGYASGRNHYAGVHR